MTITFIAHAFYYTAVSYITSRLLPYIPIATARGFTATFGKRKCHVALSLCPAGALAPRFRSLAGQLIQLVIAHETTGEILYHNGFLTNHATTPTSVVPLAQVGRTRWKVENENNNTFKTTGYHLEHNFGHV